MAFAVGRPLPFNMVSVSLSWPVLAVIWVLGNLMLFPALYKFANPPADVLDKTCSQKHWHPDTVIVGPIMDDGSFNLCLRQKGNVKARKFASSGLILLNIAALGLYAAWLMLSCFDQSPIKRRWCVLKRQMRHVKLNECVTREFIYYVLIFGLLGVALSFRQPVLFWLVMGVWSFYLTCNANTTIHNALLTGVGMSKWTNCKDPKTVMTALSLAVLLGLLQLSDMPAVLTPDIDGYSNWLKNYLSPDKTVHEEVYHNLSLFQVVKDEVYDNTLKHAHHVGAIFWSNVRNYAWDQAWLPFAVNLAWFTLSCVVHGLSDKQEIMFIRWQEAIEAMVNVITPVCVKSWAVACTIYPVVGCVFSALALSAYSGYAVMTKECFAFVFHGVSQ